MSEELSSGARHVRVRVEMVLEIAEPDELVSAAWSRIESDELLPAEEREQAARAVSRDEAEAVAYLIDPIDLVDEVPGVVLAQASWSSERAAFDPGLAWDGADELDDDLDGEGLDEDGLDALGEGPDTTELAEDALDHEELAEEPPDDADGPERSTGRDRR
ncbi:hypothetical protein RM844_03435 [Streptomyces sp. DSM 44915]|uniref:DUF5709 domain-containing protein n=1 Tax=Streptomyces chisholmiae TaxID=3075540 RepID=A0ABU2JK35_9ACTN|nr:hypothetical protein [Streptomyces sp. DSM 44915]MDT0265340.1 hypothetical protein [Streptomyces sp. DSM 44915]